MNEVNPNREENHLADIQQTIPRLRAQLDELEQMIRSGKPFTIKHRSMWDKLSQSLSHSLSNLVRETPEEIEAQRRALEQYAQRQAETPRDSRSCLQKFVDEFLQDQVYEGRIKAEWLEGDVVSCTLKHEETVTEYRSGCDDFDLPEILVTMLRNSDELDDLLDSLREDIVESACVYDFVETETHDCETNDSQVTVEVDD